MFSTNYVDTLIRPAEDCRAIAKMPDKPGTVAALTYDLLAGRPYDMTSDDVLSLVAARWKDIADQDLPHFRATFFARGQPCFRASPLTKTHGWAIHSDARGHVALISPASPIYDALLRDGSVAKVNAMRSKRA